MKAISERDPVTADQSALRAIGLSFAVIFAGVLLIAASVVEGHLNGRLSLDPVKVQLSSSPEAMVRRSAEVRRHSLVGIVGVDAP